MRIRILFIAILHLIIGCMNGPKNTSYSTRDTIEIYQKMLDYPLLKKDLAPWSADTFHVILNENFKGGYKLSYGSKKIVPIDKKDYLSRKKIFSFSFENLVMKSDSASCMFRSEEAGYIGRFQFKKSGENWEVVKYDYVRF